MDTASSTILRTPEGQFAPGCSGNPRGRPIGSRNRASVMAEALEAGEPEKLIREYADAAHQVDKVALRFCVARLVPPVRGRTIVLDLPPGMELDFRAGYTRVMRAVCDGEITPEEGLTMAKLLTVGKGKLYLSPLPAEAPAFETEEEEDDEEPAPWTSREVLFLREMARMRMAMDAPAAAAPPATGAAGAPPAAPLDAAGAAPVPSSPRPATAPEVEEKPPAEAGAVVGPSPAPAPPPRRIFGTIVRQPEVLAAKLAIV